MPPLIYCLVARDKTVLAEHAIASGNFPTVTRLLLSRLPRDHPRASYVYGQTYAFHVLERNGVTYLALAEKIIGFSVPFDFLDEVAFRFESAYEEDVVRFAIALAMNSQFAPTIEQLMIHCNNNPYPGNFGRVQSQLNDIQTVISDNIGKLLDRGEQIELLVDQTHRLSSETVHFNRRSGRFKRLFWWKNARLWIFAFLLLLFIGLVLYLCS